MGTLFYSFSRRLKKKLGTLLYSFSQAKEKVSTFLYSFFAWHLGLWSGLCSLPAHRERLKGGRCPLLFLHSSWKCMGAILYLLEVGFILYLFHELCVHVDWCMYM